MLIEKKNINSLGVDRANCVCGSDSREMKKRNTLHTLIALMALSLGSCQDNSIAPVSAQDKISSLVIQAESETNQIQTAIDLTANSITIENLALSADYFVDEHHLEDIDPLDSTKNDKPWEKECNNAFLKQAGFAGCFKNLSLTESQRNQIEAVLETYGTQQKPILTDEFHQFVDLKSQYKDRIKLDIDSLQRGNIGDAAFQNKMKQYQSEFTTEFSRQRNGSKNLSMLSVNYRSALDGIKNILSESQFKQFYLCHKK
jgi:hypothetical protein